MCNPTKPDLSNIKLIRQVVRAAENHFEENPSEPSFSLGLNDNIQFGDTPITSGLVDTKQFFRGRPNYSDYVFNFMNEAARELANTYPDKYFGCLAYFWWENTPTFPVETMVLPYQTADRSQWYDPAFKTEDMALMQRWVNAGPEIVGIYDYYYGWPYVIPRIFFTIESDSLKFAYKSGVRAFYAEAYPFWGLDGPKLWLASQLLWNINQSPKGLLDEFYNNYFQEAAIPMQRFFEICEVQWMKQPGRARWLKYFKDENQITLFPYKVCIKLRRFLDDALSKAKKPIVKKRVELVSKAFRLTELLVEYHRAKDILVRKRIDTVEDIQSLHYELSDYWTSKKNLRDNIQLLKYSHPLHQSLPDFDHLFTSSPIDRVIVSALEWAKSNQQWEKEGLALLHLLKEDIEEKQNDNYIGFKAYFEQSSVSRELLKNCNLEKIRTPEIFKGVFWPDNWKFKIRPAESVLIRLNHNAARGGKWGLEVRDSDTALIYQKVPVQAGQYYLFTTWQKGLVSPASKSALTITWQDQEGHKLGSQSSDRLPYGNIPDWTRLAVLAKAPKDATYGYIILKIYNQESDDYVWIDDLSVLELPAQ